MWCSCLSLLVSSCLLKSAYPFESCANVTFMPNGMPYVTKALYDCSSFVWDSKLPISYLPGFDLEIGTQFVLNNLISINEIDGVVALDFFLRMSWIDSRWILPGMWEPLEPQIKQQGLDITPLVSDLNNPLNIWLPDIFFQAPPFSLTFLKHVVVIFPFP